MNTKRLFLAAFPVILAISCRQDVPEQGSEGFSAETEDTLSYTKEDPVRSEDGLFETVAVVDTLTGQVTRKQRALQALSSAVGPQGVIRMDPVKPSYNPPAPSSEQQSRVIRVLTDRYWSVWGLVKINDPAANNLNKGVWFQFNPDGSYLYGQFDDSIGKGAWTFDGNQATLLMDSELLGDDREWRIKIGNAEDEMLWIGTTRFANTNVQLKLKKYDAIPQSMEEMGYEE
ncbi:MAG: hypothetical protein RLY31_1147 [Bacteroidota bacterium]|jgi:hypothetical protein